MSCQITIPARPAQSTLSVYCSTAPSGRSIFPVLPMTAPSRGSRASATSTRATRTTWRASSPSGTGAGAAPSFALQQSRAARATRTHAREIPALWTDIDYKGVDPAEDVAAGLARLRYPPSLIVSSGHGAHLYWLLKEPLDAQADRARDRGRAAPARRHGGGRPAGLRGGAADAPARHAQHQGRGVDPVTAVQTREEPYRYTLEELEDWLAEAAPVLRRRKATNPVTAEGIHALPTTTPGSGPPRTSATSRASTSRPGSRA